MNSPFVFCSALLPFHKSVYVSTIFIYIYIDALVTYVRNPSLEKGWREGGKVRFWSPIKPSNNCDSVVDLETKFERKISVLFCDVLFRRPYQGTLLSRVALFNKCTLLSQAVYRRNLEVAVRPTYRASFVQLLLAWSRVLLVSTLYTLMIISLYPFFSNLEKIAINFHYLNKCRKKVALLITQRILL